LKLEIHAIDWFNILLYSEIITITVVKQEKKGNLGLWELNMKSP